MGWGGCAYDWDDYACAQWPGRAPQGLPVEIQELATVLETAQSGNYSFLEISKISATLGEGPEARRLGPTNPLAPVPHSGPCATRRSSPWGT